jgi:hypothetical protein
MILISGIFMGSAFFETMGINYVLPVAECESLHLSPLLNTINGMFLLPLR